MKTIRDIVTLKEELSSLTGMKVGLVPTMGALHEGHLSLVKKSVEENDFTVVSIFVNPTQFAPTEDLNTYPRDLKQDEQLLKENGVQLIFYPDVEEMYPKGYDTFVSVESLGKKLCGKNRPTHFKGVTTIVMKLFHCVDPDCAYFGQKDAQQAIIIKRMVEDLNMNVKIRIMPIVRDSDGLALSSRNSYLSRAERDEAQCLPKGLNKGRFMINEGIDDPRRIKQNIIEEVKKGSSIKIDYVEIVRLDTLEPLKKIDPDNTLVAAAVRIGKTRLIDNFILGEI